MTRPLREAMVKEDDGSVMSDHLRNHVHLTNCIHLKNHMHRHSPIMTERSLMRNLIALQRSRSLRDPSTSPPSWHSPQLGISMARRFEKDITAFAGRRSVEYQRDTMGLFANSPRVSSVSKAKVSAVADANSDGDEFGELIALEVARREGESSKKNRKSSLSGGSTNAHGDSVLGRTEMKERFASHVGTLNPSGHLHLSSELLENLSNFREAGKSVFTDDVAHMRNEDQMAVCEDEPQTSNHVNVHGTTRGRRRKFKGPRRARRSADGGVSVATNSFAQRPKGHGHGSKEAEEDVEMEVSRDPRNGCGIPWNWSRIHHRGKVFLDMAGRSLSCGRSEARMRRAECAAPRSQIDNSDAAAAADHCSHSLEKSDSDAHPLLNEPYDSHGTLGNPFPGHDYSGELGIFASQDHHDSDLTSEADNNRASGLRRGRHRSLSQKYMPRTFRDLVGQNLVAQALSNAILRNKVGLVYVFHGPQGTGKTSCARIFAKALNCLSPDHPKPCGSCNSCISQTMGKCRNVVEVGQMGNFDFERIVDVFESMMLSSHSSHYRVFIIDDCETLPMESWNALSKIIDRARRHVVFLLISSNADNLPHNIISRCQKFFFPKLKDADIIYKLQFIATKEGLDVDKDALKLIASRADGSLRDAEMTLDQLSLLGQKISVSLVQELAGLVSDEKLVNLLDMALSADTVNTVKSLRGIMEAGVEPLALMTQLATIITDILAGSYVVTRERLRRKFFRSAKLSKDDMEKLRQALKTLSEAEKQLRTSNDRLTWLTAALLQLAPDHQYLLPNSSVDASLRSSPMLLNYNSGNIGAIQDNVAIDGGDMTDANLTNRRRNPIIGYMDTDKIWKEVIEKININSLKQFMLQEGKLLSVSFGAAPTVQIFFSSRANKSKAEKFRGHILQAFESVLSTAVTLEIRCESWKNTRPEAQVSCDLPTSAIVSSQMVGKQESCSSEGGRNGAESLLRRLSKDSVGKGVGPSSLSERANHNIHEKAKCEAVGSASHQTRDQEAVGRTEQGRKRVDSSKAEQASCSHNPVNFHSASKRTDNEEQPRRQSLVRGKVSLAHVIQHVEGCTQRTGWSRRKAISIAEKLEQENLSLESRSRSSLCGKAKQITRTKLLHLRVKTRQPHSLLKLVSCGKCSCARTASPRQRT